MSSRLPQSYQLLLVEDDPGDAGLIRHALRDDRFGRFEATWVTTLGEARDRLSARDFDAVLLDLTLPDSQGLETVRGGLEAARDVPVVVLTGRDDEELALRILEMGAQDYLVKGRHDTDALLRALRHALARARTERALRRSEALLSGILDNTVDAIWSATWPDFQVLFVSPSIERIFGRPRDDFQDNPRLWFEAIESEDRSISEAGQRELLRHGFADVEYRIRRPDGEIAWVRDRSKVIRRPNGGPERVDGVVSDITRRRQAEEQLQRHQEELEQMVAERTRDLQDSLERLKKTQTLLLHAEKMASMGQLAAGIAHEINTPCQYIGDNSRFLRQAITDLGRVCADHAEVLDAAGTGRLDRELLARMERIHDEVNVEFLLQESPRAIEEIMDGVERISLIVSSMREFAHPGGTEKSITDLNKALQNSVTVARNEWKYTATVELDLDPNLPNVLCVPNELNQVFLNLLINACHAVRDKHQGDDSVPGVIRISTRHLDEQVEIRIRDSGTGIPANIQTKIFDPFFTTKEVGKGTGQGLAIAYAIVVEKHQGEISFETRQGEGTTFIIRLPVGG